MPVLPCGVRACDGEPARRAEPAGGCAPLSFTTKHFLTGPASSNSACSCEQTAQHARRQPREACRAQRATRTCSSETLNGRFRTKTVLGAASPDIAAAHAPPRRLPQGRDPGRQWATVPARARGPGGARVPWSLSYDDRRAVPVRLSTSRPPFQGVARTQRRRVAAAGAMAALVVSSAPAGTALLSTGGDAPVKAAPVATQTSAIGVIVPPPDIRSIVVRVPQGQPSAALLRVR